MTAWLLAGGVVTLAALADVAAYLQHKQDNR